MKIFKYQYDPLTSEVTMPEKHTIIRVDHVDDGFYKGDFIWAIVDPKHEKVHQKLDLSEWQNVSVDNFDLTDLQRIQLSVKEKQEITITGLPIVAGEDDGKMFVYYSDFDFSLFARLKKYKIAVFKTGQQIDIDLSKATYIGLCRLWIIQELGLYVFLYE